MHFTQKKKMNKIKHIDTETEYLYKCRMCGKIFSGGESGTEKSYSNLIDAIFNITVDNQPPLPMIRAHQCNDKKGGIADLVGYKIV